MTETCSDPLVRRIWTWCRLFCPPRIQEHVVAQALADLVHDRASAGRSVRRRLVTMQGVTRLGLALAVSLVVLRRQWREASWWPAPVVTRDALGWVTLLTLVALLRAALARPEGTRTWTLLPDFVAAQALPLALPAAALAIALLRHHRRAASTVTLAAAAAALSLALTVGVPAGTGSLLPETATGAAETATVSGVPIRGAAWQRLQELRGEQWGRYGLHEGVALAAFCLLLPALASLAAARFRLQVRTVPALVIAVAVLDLLFRWISTIPAPSTATPDALLVLWLPHLVLAGCILSLALSLIAGPPVA